jgi:hypothetical protein
VCGAAAPRLVLEELTGLEHRERPGGAMRQPERIACHRTAVICQTCHEPAISSSGKLRRTPLRDRYEVVELH